MKMLGGVCKVEDGYRFYADRSAFSPDGFNWIQEELQDHCWSSFSWDFTDRSMTHKSGVCNRTLSPSMCRSSGRNTRSVMSPAVSRLTSWGALTPSPELVPSVTRGKACAERGSVS